MRPHLSSIDVCHQGSVLWLQLRLNLRCLERRSTHSVPQPSHRQALRERPAQQATGRRRKDGGKLQQELELPLGDHLCLLLLQSTQQLLATQMVIGDHVGARVWRLRQVRFDDILDKSPQRHDEYQRDCRRDNQGVRIDHWLRRRAVVVLEVASILILIQAAGVLLAGFSVPGTVELITESFVIGIQNLVHDGVGGHRAHQEAHDTQDTNESCGTVSRRQGKGFVEVMVPLRRSDDSFSQRWLLVRHQRFGTCNQETEPQVFVERVVAVLKSAAKVLC
mmetsp:Transcript_14763/g.55879  ORF Transcript_14763/g.55879 Transcript_14763/m.55879 type:complete len:278 (+) Transcript_14763:1353-2186(+)